MSENTLYMAAFGTRWALICSHLFQIPTLEFGTVPVPEYTEVRAPESGHWAIPVSTKLLLVLGQLLAAKLMFQKMVSDRA